MLARSLGNVAASGSATLDIGAALAQAFGAVSLDADGEAITPPLEGVLDLSLGALICAGMIFKWDAQQSRVTAWSVQSGGAGSWSPQNGAAGVWSNQSGAAGHWEEQSKPSGSWTVQ
jgi:hypothetical protein